MLNAIDKVLFLMRVGITAEVTTDGLSRLAALANEVELERGSKLFESGGDAEALWIILDGAVRVDIDGVPPRLAEAGDWVGAMPLFTGAAHRGTASVVCTSRLLRVDAADLNELLDEDGELGRALFSGLLRSLAALIPSAAEAA